MSRSAQFPQISEVLASKSSSSSSAHSLQSTNPASPSRDACSVASAVFADLNDSMIRLRMKCSVQCLPSLRGQQISRVWKSCASAVQPSLYDSRFFLVAPANCWTIGPRRCRNVKPFVTQLASFDTGKAGEKLSQRPRLRTAKMGSGSRLGSISTAFTQTEENAAPFYSRLL